MIKFNQSESGHTLAEVVVALGVTAIVVVALIIITLLSLKDAQYAQNQSKASKLAQEAVEQVKSIRDRNGMVTFTDLSGSGTYCTSDDTITFNNLYFCGLASDPGSYFGPSPCTIAPSGVTDILGCYFKLVNVGGANTLVEAANPFSTTEKLENGLFERQVFINDKFTDSLCNGTILCDFTVEKQVTVIVSWEDNSGKHQSKVQTVLRKGY